MTQKNVAVPTWILVSGGGAIVVLACSVAFLAGRQTVRAPPPVMVHVPAVAGAPAPSPAEVAPVPSPAPAEPAPLPAAATTTTAAVEPRVEPPPARAATAPARDPARDAVAAYFRDLEAAEGPEQLGTGDATAVAQQLVQAATAGDTTQLDQMVRRYDALKARVAAVAAPAECQEHHALAVRTVGAGAALLRSIQASLSGGGLSALGDINGRAADIKESAEAGDRLAAELKRKYGLP